MEQEQKSIEEIVLTSKLTYVVLGLVLIAGIIEGIGHQDQFAHALSAIDLAVVLVVLAFGGVTTLLLQSVMTPGAQTASNKRDFVIARFMFWTAFLAFFLATFLFYGPNGYIATNNIDTSKFYVFQKAQITEVCGQDGWTANNSPHYACYLSNQSNGQLYPANGAADQPIMGSFLVELNQTRQVKNLSSVFYKQ